MRNVGIISLVISTACSDSYVKDVNEEEIVVLDQDGDGFHAGEDCDDFDAEINPDAIEVCDEIDNDCDELIDDADDSLDVTTADIFYEDADEDGFGSAEIEACVQPEGTSVDAGDCDDFDAEINPDAIEVCDEIDNDCDELIDDADDSLDVTTGITFYTDGDADGYGDLASSIQACVLQFGTVENSDDCDDSDDAIHPDATEVCDEVDNNCDGLIDDADPSVDSMTQSIFYMDYDVDGFGDDLNSTMACTTPNLYVDIGGDCNDSDAEIHPNALELCDGIDNNCDTILDDPNTVSGITGGVYTDYSAIFQGTSSAPASLTLNEEEYVFCDGTYYVSMDAESDVSLSANGSVTLDGTNTEPILYSTQDNVVVTVSDFIFQNGYRAIILVGADAELNISNTEFHNNIALGVQNGTSVSGGAIAIEDGELNISGSTFTGNEANFGGAITISGGVTIDNTTFDGNIGRLITVAGEDTGGQGGAINWQATSNASVFEITDSDFINNTAERVGSAIGMYALDASLNSYSAVMTLDTVLVDGNISNAHTIASNGGTFLILDSDLTNNDSGEGGVVMVNYFSEAQLTNTIVDDNVSTMAGAIQIFGDSSVECTGGSSITNNASGATFGAVSLSEVSSIFTSDACDMGGSSSSTENTPFDILTFNGITLGNYTYDGIQTFECTGNGCPEASCTDGVDDNGDGLIDCDDPTCSIDPTCGGSNVPEDCYTTGDEDNDGLADCDDPDCSGEQICLSTTEIECQDGVDNDSDGYFDCLDGECRNPIGVPLMMNQATDDWLQPDPSCYQSMGTLQTNDFFFGENTTEEGCVRYFTDAPEVDTILVSLNQCPSLGGTMLDCNDDVDVSSGDYTSEIFIDSFDGGYVLFALSAYDTSTASDQSVTLSSEIPTVCYTLNMTDGYGDGWNGASLDVSQNGVTTSYSNTDQNGSSCSSGCEETTTETICLDAVSFDLAWTQGSWDGEVSFEILDAAGNTVCAEGANPTTPCGGEIVPSCDQL